MFPEENGAGGGGRGKARKARWGGGKCDAWGSTGRGNLAPGWGIWACLRASADVAVGEKAPVAASRLSLQI